MDDICNGQDSEMMKGLTFDVMISGEINDEEEEIMVGENGLLETFKL